MSGAQEIPRRMRIDQFTPAELAIHRATEAVEALPAHVQLTEAGILLSRARNKVADWVDSCGETVASRPGIDGPELRDLLAAIASLREQTVTHRDGVQPAEISLISWSQHVLRVCDTWDRYVQATLRTKAKA